MNRRTLLQALLGLPFLRRSLKAEQELRTTELVCTRGNVGLGTATPTALLHVESGSREILRITPKGEIVQNGKVINTDSDAVRDAFIEAGEVMKHL